MHVYVLALECTSACMYICVCVSVHVILCMPIFVLAHLVHCCCHRSVKRVPRWRALVCRLSVWRWRHHGLSRKLGSEVWKERKRAWDPSIHPCIHPHSPTKPQTRSRESRKGEEGKVEMEQHRKRETIWVCWKSESDICKSLQAQWGCLACFHSPGKTKSPAACFPASTQPTMPLKS